MKAAKAGFKIVVLSFVTCCVVATWVGSAGGIIIWPNCTYIGKIVIVSPFPGETAAANGTALLNALAGITTASSTEPYLLKLGPGIYDLGTNSLQMKPYVDIEGSGENVTIIQGSVGSPAGTSGSGLVNGASNAEIRFLTVQNMGGGEDVIAIFNVYASLKMTNVTVIASGGTNNYGIYNADCGPTIMTNVTVTASGGSWNEGVVNWGSTLTMRNVTATASDGSNYNMAIDNTFFSALTMKNVTAIASGGSHNRGVSNTTASSLTIYDSVIKGTINTIYNGQEVWVLVANTQLDGGSVSNSGTVICVGAYNTTYVPLGTNCQ